ncbi:MAG: hypothetical protein JW867_05040 [Candidatus Omnitrophica bacterium]|nr:hypothetical protein [Candidatus Omnitrophota bacterium]
METNLEGLIAKIRKDGIEEAQKSAENILEKAKKEAQDIIEKAKVNAKTIDDNAKASAESLKANTESALRQAARDLVLSLRKEIENIFYKALKEKIQKELDADFLKKLISKLVEAWSKDGNLDMKVLVSKEDKEKLEKLLISSLKDQANKGLEIKISNNIDKGFRLGIKDDSLYYDFTDQSILEQLKVFLNPSIIKILDSVDE